MADLNLLNQTLAEVLVCACNILSDGLCDEDGSNCGCPCRAFVSAGPPVWDLEACCSDGQLSVHATDIFPFQNFPARQGTVNVCQNNLAATVVVTLLRCWPANVNDDGSAPNAAEIQAASEAIYRDLYLLTWGLLCCLQVSARKRKFLLSSGRILPPNGGCVGAEVTFSIELFDVS